MARMLWASVIVVVLYGSTLAGSDVLTELDLHRVFFADIRTGYALGTSAEAATILKTTDGGVSWKAVYQTKIPLFGVQFRSPEQGWVVGGAGTILSTSDGGKTWKVAPSGTKDDLLAVTSDRSGEIFAVGKKGDSIEVEGQQW